MTTKNVLKELANLRIIFQTYESWLMELWRWWREKNIGKPPDRWSDYHQITCLRTIKKTRKKEEVQVSCSKLRGRLMASPTASQAGGRKLELGLFTFEIFGIYIGILICHFSGMTSRGNLYTHQKGNSIVWSLKFVLGPRGKCSPSHPPVVGLCSAQLYTAEMTIF